MSSEWRKVTFGELIDDGVLEIGDGYRAKNDELSGDGLIFLRAGHVKDTHIDFDDVDRFSTNDEVRFGRKIALAGDVVITTKGNSTGRIAVVTSDMPRFVYSPHLSYWRSMSEGVITQGFLRAWARSSEFSSQLESLSRSTDMAPYLSLRDQRRLEITLPPNDVQRVIDQLSDALSMRLDLLRETNGTLEAIAQALFKSWFVDFDPVRAKIGGSAPQGMDEATSALFPDALEETELGVVPKGWELTGFGRLIDLIKGCSYKGEGLSEAEGAYMFNLGCFNAHRVFASEKVKRYLGEYKPRHAVETGDLIIANTDMTQARDILGRPAFVPHGMAPGFISHHVYKVNVLPEWEDWAVDIRAFVFFALQQAGFRERAIGFATGTTVLALPAAAVLGSITPFPRTELLSFFGRTVKPLLDAIAINEQRAATLADLRDTLLPRLISGQLRLPDAQAQMEDALA